MSSRSGGRSAVISLLAVLAAVGTAALAIPFLVQPPAGIDIRLEDSVFATDLAGKVVQVRRLDGKAEISLPVSQTAVGFMARIERIASGPHQLEVSMPGFRPTTIRLDAPPLQRARVDAPLTPSFGRLEVAVFDAGSADQPVTSGVSVRAGDHSATGSGTVLFAALDPETYQVAVTAPGYCGTAEEARVIEAETTRLTVRLPSEPRGTEKARIMLDWDENPEDLDAHVLLSDSSVPLISNHVFFRNKAGEIRNSDRTAYAELDVDWLRSEGVETMTIFDGAEGVYQYFVHLYRGEGSLGRSAATVEVVTAGCRSTIFRVPTECAHRWWYVADLKVTQDEVQLIDRNSCQARQPFSWDQRKR